MTRYRFTAAAVLLIVAGTAYGYSIHVNKVADFPSSFKRLAMLPAVGPAGVDAIWVEQVVLEKFLKKKLQVVPAVVVRQVMFDMGIKQLDESNRHALADRLQVDAFIAAAVDSAGTENAGSVGVFIGAIFTAVPTDRNTGSVQLAIVSAETGRVLMEGTGYGQSELRSKKGVIGKTFAEIVDRAFTPAFFIERSKAEK